MTQIKYYDLESKSFDESSDLEGNLQKFLLSENYINGTSKCNEDDSQLGKDDELNPTIYDSGDFEVLYKKSKTVSDGKRRWFRKDIPKRIRTELVVKADPKDIIALQSYFNLYKSGLEVSEARKVNTANLGFITRACHDGVIIDYQNRIESFIKSQFPKVTSQLSAQKDVSLDKKEGSVCTGMVYGPVLDVLKIRQILVNGGYGISIYEEAVSFLN